MDHISSHIGQQYDSEDQMLEQNYVIYEDLDVRIELCDFYPHHFIYIDLGTLINYIYIHTNCEMIAK